MVLLPVSLPQTLQFEVFAVFSTQHECCHRSATCHKLLMTLSARLRAQHLTVTFAQKRSL